MNIINSVKGTLYDLLGYFAPGLIALTGVTFIVLRAKNIADPWSLVVSVVKDLTAEEVFVLIVFAYILGHAIASVSSWSIEKNLIKKKIDVKQIVGESHYVHICEKFDKLFSAQYGSKSDRKVICYVQAKQPAIYETALVFLSFYGMARNLTLVFGFFALAEIFFIHFNIGSITVLVIQTVLCLVFLYEYFRFRKYFIDTIFSGFLIPEQ